MTHLENLVYETIFEIQSIKRGNSQFPDLALKTEIYNSIKIEILEALRSLYRRHIISFSRNVNGIEMFGIIQQPND